MESLNESVNSYVNYLYRLQNNYFVPFFENDYIVMAIAVFFIFLLLKYEKDERAEKLFKNSIYRLLWILMIIMLTLYRPVIGFLAAIAYLKLIV